MEKLVKDQLEVIQRKEDDLGLKRKHFEECCREFELKKEQFGLKEESFAKCCVEFDLRKKAFEERLKDFDFNVKEYEQECKRVDKQLVEVKRKEEEIGLKEKQLEQRMRDFELKEKVSEERYEELVAKEKHCAEGFREINLKKRNLEQSTEELRKKTEDVKVKAKSVENFYEEVKMKKEELGLKERDLKQRCRDVELSESLLQKGHHDLELKSKQYEERFKKLKLTEKMMKNQFEELKEKEKQFGLEKNHFEQCSREPNMKERSLEKGHHDLEAKQKHYEECLREIKLKEKQIEESSEQLRSKYEFQFKDLELKVNQYDQRFTELKQLEESSEQMTSKYNLRFKDLELKVKQYDQRLMELKLKEKLVKDQFEQLETKREQMESKERLFEQCSKDFDLKEKHLEQRFQELEAKEKQYDESLRKVKIRETEIEELSAELRRKYEQQSKDLEFNVKNCEQRFKDLELKGKILEEWSKELQRKGRHASALHPQVKTEAAGSFPVKFSVDHSSSAHLCFCVNMNGKDLQMFLNERWKEHGSVGTEVAMALRLSSDPAKIVLDAMEGFYPPHLSKGDIVFEGNVVRRSCIILLEQLMKLSPEIKPLVRKEGMKLAFAWITKMKVEPGHTLEVLGFLQLLASFRLADAFDPDELVNFFLSVAQHSQTPELFKVLGLGDKITGFIRKLVERKQHLEAIRFIYAFEQVKEFPVVPLLNDYLFHSKVEARKIFKKGKKNPEEQKAARTKRIVALRNVVKCVEDHKLESEHLPQNLKIKNLNNSIALFEKQNVSRSRTSTNANRIIHAAPKTPSQQHIRAKRPRALIVSEISGNASLSGTTSVSSAKIPSKHLNQSNQDCKSDSKSSPIPLREQIKQEPNSKQLEQQDAVKNQDAIPNAAAVSSTSAPAPTAPATISASEPQENGSKRPRTDSSQKHHNLPGFGSTDFHTNPNRKGVADYYSWDALARPGDKSE
ncbi:hypothetical protein PTKIN_Ptkin06aG0160100 [Pterospermum kingtungense]